MLAAAGQLARRRAAWQLANAAADCAAGSSSSSGGGGAASAARQALRRGWQLQPSHRVATGSWEQQAAVLAKARRMSGPVGLLAGVFGSIVGVGGGVIIVPSIVSACKSIPQRVVSGTSLAAVLSTALVSSHTYSSQGHVDAAAALLISPAALLTAPLGARLTARLNCTALRRILGYFLLAAAPMVPLKALLLSGGGEEEQPAAGRSSSSSSSRSSSSSSSSSRAEDAVLAPAAAAAGLAGAPAGLAGAPAAAPALAADSPAEPAAAAASFSLEGLEFPPPAKAALLVATGAVAGLASGLLGVGGGLIVTPLLAVAMPYAQATVLGTSLLSMIPPASAALVQHHRLGNVDWRMAAGLAAGTAVGGVAGSNLAVQAPAGFLEAAFCLGMLFLGRKTLQAAR